MKLFIHRVGVLQSKQEDFEEKIKKEKEVASSLEEEKKVKPNFITLPHR